MKKSQKKPAIVLKNITKIYTVHHEKPTFSEKLLYRSKTEKYTAINNLSLTIHKGEKIGLVGPNGAGKTTLLKIIAGITTPNSGSVQTYGKVVSLINLEAGFHPELSGQENIFLNGLILGMSRAEISQNYQSIIDFADIGSFIDAPFYTYSSGMKLRLAFSVAIHSDPEILLLDENIMVGDEYFQKKIEQYLHKIFKEKKTIIVVSHWMEFLERMCNKIISLESIQNS